MLVEKLFLRHRSNVEQHINLSVEDVYFLFKIDGNVV